MTASGSTLSTNQRDRLEKRIREIEQLIPKLEAESARLSEEMSAPSIASDYGKLAELTQKLKETEQQTQALFDEWDAAAKELK